MAEQLADESAQLIQSGTGNASAHERLNFMPWPC
jgi:hypothetical protein